MTAIVSCLRECDNRIEPRPKTLWSDMLTARLYMYIYIYTGWPICNQTLILIASVFHEADLKSVITD